MAMLKLSAFAIAGQYVDDATISTTIRANLVKDQAPGPSTSMSRRCKERCS